ncbi:unnamed protein product, partial [Iphiclides podalirius]
MIRNTFLISTIITITIYLQVANEGQLLTQLQTSGVPSKGTELLSCTSVRDNEFFQKQLNPVHGLFVKPSEDGVTGDLYVAATEDDGVHSQWLTDHPVNFLPSAAATQTQAASIPVTYTSSITSSTSPHEETVTTHKRAVITSPSMKYAYALPVSGTADGGPMHPYPYGFYAPNVQNSDESPQCRSESSPASPPGLHTYPYPYYYPHMMTALSAAMHAMKESEEDSSPKVLQPPPFGWPAAYAYPYQYVMVDPSAWAPSSTRTSGKIATEKEAE